MSRNNISPKDENGIIHGRCISYINNNIFWIEDFKHGKECGLQQCHNTDGTIDVSWFCRNDKGFGSRISYV